MEIDDKIDIKHKSDYLKLVLKISKIRYQGDEPSKELLQQKREMGRLAGISEQELENLWTIRYLFLISNFHILTP